MQNKVLAIVLTLIAVVGVSLAVVRSTQDHPPMQNTGSGATN